MQETTLRTLKPGFTLLVAVVLVVTAGCSAYQSTGGTTERDKTKKGAAIGAAAGAAAAILAGKDEADDILARTALGAGIGAGIGGGIDAHHQWSTRWRPPPAYPLPRVKSIALVLSYLSSPVRRRNLRVVLFSLAITMLLAMLDNTIVGTALPRIIGDLRGDPAHLSWVVTAYLLGSTVSTPIWGKIGDLYGRKGIFVTYAQSPASTLSSRS